jgi:hypothetical protein
MVGSEVVRRGVVVALNFSAQFSTAIESGCKTQTIREKARCKAGDRLELYTGQRTKSCRLLRLAVCKDVTYIGLAARRLTLGNSERFPREIDEFARSDGFSDFDEMWLWFSERYKTHSFTGYVIRWHR